MFSGGQVLELTLIRDEINTYGFLLTVVLKTELALCLYCVISMSLGSRGWFGASRNIGASFKITQNKHKENHHNLNYFLHVAFRAIF